MNCPQCNSANIRRSQSSSWKDAVRSLRGRQAFRCRECRHRFFAHPSALSAEQAKGRTAPGTQRKKFSDPKKKRRLVRRVIAVAVVVAMFALFGVFLRYVSTDHAPKGPADDTSSSSD